MCVVIEFRVLNLWFGQSIQIVGAIIGEENCWSYRALRVTYDIMVDERERKEGLKGTKTQLHTWLHRITKTSFLVFFIGKKSKFTRETHYIWVDLKLSSNSTNSFFEVTYPIFKYVYIISNDKEWWFKWRELKFEFTQQIVIVSPLKVNHPSKCV